jgi:hypothetical protein
MSIEAMKQWREALKEYCEHGTIFMPLTALKSIDQAIADFEKQEPVAWQAMVENEAIKEFPIKDMAHDWCVHQQLSGSPYAYWLRPLYTHPQPKREPPTTREVKDVLRATGLLTNSQAWDVAEEVMKLLAAHGITSDMKQEHVDKTAKQRHKENT